MKEDQTIAEMYALKFFLGACQRPKHRDGARRFAPDTPQVFY